jgi:hypothetical protein
MIHLIMCLTRVFLYILFTAPLLALHLLASLYLCEKLSKHTRSEQEFYLDLLLWLSVVPSMFLSVFLLKLIDGWIGWR